MIQLKNLKRVTVCVFEAKTLFLLPLNKTSNSWRFSEQWHPKPTDGHAGQGVQTIEDTTAVTENTKGTRFNPGIV